MPTEFRIERDDAPNSARNQITFHTEYVTPASGYRLSQAEDLLREIGYVEHSDGTWLPPDNA